MSISLVGLERYLTQQMRLMSSNSKWLFQKIDLLFALFVKIKLSFLTLKRQ